MSLHRASRVVNRDIRATSGLLLLKDLLEEVGVIGFLGAQDEV